MKCVVVKLGGSSARGRAMSRWIAALASSSLPIVIVPGGGPFADEVRRAQRELDFSEAAAHAMAILAMDQFGHVVLDRHERLVPARTLAEIGRALENGRIPVWLPSTLAIGAPDIPASWDVTSDSIAAWLAGRIGGHVLLLIKQTQAFSRRDDLAALAEREIVDAAFSTMLPFGIDLHIAGPADLPLAGACLSAGKIPGLRIPVSAPTRKAG
jgi:aspartokinase-like uncharacterized kinase